MNIFSELCDWWQGDLAAVLRTHPCVHSCLWDKHNIGYCMAYYIRVILLKYLGILKYQCEIIVNLFTNNCEITTHNINEGLGIFFDGKDKLCEICWWIEGTLFRHKWLTEINQYMRRVWSWVWHNFNENKTLCICYVRTKLQTLRNTV